MENQHKKIKGYRDLSQTEIDLMNKVKEKGVELGALVAEVTTYLRQQAEEAKKNAYTDEPVAYAGTTTATIPVLKDVDSDEVAEYRRIEKAEAQRWAAIAKTDFQTGLMALTRAIAQPGFF